MKREKITKAETPCMFEPRKGDIVQYTESVYIDFPGGKWCDHFADVKQLAVCLDTVPTNAGYFRAKDKTGKVHNFMHVSMIEAIYRKTV